MPKLQKIFTLEITPEQFLKNCSPIELKEIDTLIQSNFYKNRMNARICKICDLEKPDEEKNWYSKNICFDCSQTSIINDQNGAEN